MATKQKYEFSYVNSEEELEAELRATNREITEVVVHWTGTFLNQDIGAEEVHSWHTQRGFSGCGYHYLIRKDGRLQRGRPLERAGAHALANGHNNFSIGISFVAGYNCMSGDPDRDQKVGSGSINENQFKSFDNFMRAFYKVYPGGQAFGHADTDDKGKTDPGFDVEDYVFNKFGKQNTTLGSEKAKSRVELVNTPPHWQPQVRVRT
jgi:N-acetylmuramoyl-L-alanine amidase